MAWFLLQVERALHSELASRGAYPSQLNFHGFPRSVSVSVNDVAVHGVADEAQELKEGDLVSVDVSSFLHGFHGDCTKTFIVGEKYRLDSNTRKAFSISSSHCHPRVGFKFHGNFALQIIS